MVWLRFGSECLAIIRMPRSIQQGERKDLAVSDRQMPGTLTQWFDEIRLSSRTPRLRR
jgi:hypothetical protein